MADIFNYAPHPSSRVAQSGNFFLLHHQLSEQESIASPPAGKIVPSNYREEIAPYSLTISSDRTHDPSSSSSSPASSSSSSSSLSHKFQVFEDYGDNSDEVYFKYHGFVHDVNPFRCVTLEPTNDMLQLITTAQKAVLEGLEFKRPPNRCVDAINASSHTTSIINAANHGYFGKGLEIYMVVLGR